MNSLSRFLVFTAVFLTGATALLAQVAWQKYYGHLIGSDQRSSALVLALFLVGLTFGYWFFGKIVSNEVSRRLLLSRYARIEVLIGFLFLAFPHLFRILHQVTVHLPASILTDFILLLPGTAIPAFLMGATLPLLSLVLPNQIKEVESCHTRVYGWNTLGAFFGAIIGGLLVLPAFGLKQSFYIAGFTNTLAGFALYLISKRRELEATPLTEGSEKRQGLQKVSARSLLLAVFIVGAVSISMELVIMRVLAVSLSSIYVVFPLVVGAFVFGIGLGSLSLEKKLRLGKYRWFSPLWIGFFSILAIYTSAPYWPLISTALKDLLSKTSWGWPAYLILISVLLFLVVFPMTFFLGQILPASFAHQAKNSYEKNKSKDAVRRLGGSIGLVYATSSIGTLFGALGLGYLFLSFMNLDDLIKCNLVALLLVIFVFAKEERKNIHTYVVIAAALLVFIIPRWNRTFLVYPATPSSVIDSTASKSWGFPAMKSGVRVVSHKDGPDMSVSVTEFDLPHPSGRNFKSMALDLNGKPDGNTYSDFATNALLSLTPYLLGPDRDQIKAALVGLGTGVSAGVLGSVQQVKHLDVIEISDTVIQAAKHFEPFNFGVLKNPKIRLHQQDAVRFLRNSNEIYDLIISEPSNLWMSGMENLYTPEYLKLVANSLADDGLYAQWIHGYNLDLNVFLSAAKNLIEEFANVEMYSLQPGDFVILASRKQILNSAHPQRYAEDFVTRLRFRLGWRNPASIALAHRIGGEGLRNLIKIYKPDDHTLEAPTLAIRAARAHFFGTSLQREIPWPSEYSRLWSQLPLKQSEFVRLANEFENYYPECVTYANLLSSICVTFMTNRPVYKTYKDANRPPFERLMAYKSLRDRSLIPADLPFLNELDRVISEKSADISVADVAHIRNIIQDEQKRL